MISLIELCFAHEAEASLYRKQVRLLAELAETLANEVIRLQESEKALKERLAKYEAV